MPAHAVKGDAIVLIVAFMIRRYHRWPCKACDAGPSVRLG